MDTKIFLQGFDSKKSSNTSEGLDVQFKGRKKLLPLNDIAEVISQYDLYREEREKCNTIRLTLQVNPICSNVLFNRISEIVHNEGSSAVTFINYSLNPSGDSTTFDKVIYKKKTMDFWNSGDMKYQHHDDTVYNSLPNKRICEINDDTHYTNGELNNLTIPTTNNGPVEHHPTNAIRDTQLSKNDIGFVYHCGLDFLNNHLVRSNTFKTVCKCPENLNPDYTAFNTIADLMRTVNGEKVIEKLYFPITEDLLANKEYLKLLTLHLYEYDDILSYEKTVEERLIPKYDGWVGFHNRPKIKSYSAFSDSDSMEIERPLSYLNSGDFIDMYPGRDLYSFVPKYNTFQRRIEKNWNYNITYPSSSYTPSHIDDPFVDIFEINEGINSLRTVYFDENIRADNGITQLVMYSISKHGLAVGDYVNIYKTYDTMLYWVSKKIEDSNDYERVTIRYEEEGKANDEMAILQKEDPNGTYRVDNSGKEVTVNHKIIDNAEVSEVVDDFIFTVFNSNTQISDKWVWLADDEKYGGATVTVDGVTYEMEARGHYFIDPSDSSKKYYVVNGNYVNFDKKAQRISYKKTYGDIECEYYIRIFSKLPNFKFASGDTSSEYEIYRKRGTDTTGKERGLDSNITMLSIYQDKMYDFENHISRLAFAKNIYTDEVGEVVYTDDIDISNIHDNLGRPLTSLYMTFIKNNKGYKEWYGWKNQVKDWSTTTINNEFENIEYSHCFGPVTCGIKTSDESIYDNSIKNIVKINNIDQNVGYNINIINGNNALEGRSYKDSKGNDVKIDNWEIWYELDKHFYGDLCYYDNYNAIERHIQYVNHRFSTAQREIREKYHDNEKNRYFEKYVYDEIRADDYDADSDGKSYWIESYPVEKCDNFQEGYYYNPHYEIPIKTFDKLQSVLPDFLSIRQFTQIEDGVYKFVTLQQHFLSDGDKAMLYDAIQDKYYKLVAVSGDSDNYKVFTCKVYDEKTDEQVDITYLDAVDKEQIILHLSTSLIKWRNTSSTTINSSSVSNVKVSSFKLFKMDNLNVPSYARVLRDGTCRIIWRNILNNGFNKSDDSVEEYPFTNGAFYINKRIDIYVRRQDPYNVYGLYNDSDIKGNITDITKEDNYIKEADIEC